MERFPECPRNTPNECRFTEGPVMSTLLGWQQTYNRKGEATGVDPNTHTQRIQCKTCYQFWMAQEYRGEHSFKKVKFDARTGEVK